MDRDSGMHTELTPNPDSVKWIVPCDVPANAPAVALEPGITFRYSPLGVRLFAIEGVQSVLLARDSITINKAPEVEWRPLGQAVSEAIREWQASSESVLGEDYQPPPQEEGDEVLARIRRVLEEEIASYVEQDGGAIDLEGFESGVVKLRLRGACESCPNSAVTLKAGIESRLRQEIPEVQRVESIG